MADLSPSTKAQAKKLFDALRDGIPLHLTPLAPVKSSQVKAVGYHAPTKTLVVQYHNGGVYHYHGVAPETHASLHKAESIGKFLAQHVKPKNKFTKAGLTEKG